MEIVNDPTAADEKCDRQDRDQVKLLSVIDSRGYSFKTSVINVRRIWNQEVIGSINSFHIWTWIWFIWNPEYFDFPSPLCILKKSLAQMCTREKENQNIQDSR